MRKSNSKSGRSFDSVPADDGFRNYMSRKIELQRRQFGLILPPPPDADSFSSSTEPSLGNSNQDEDLKQCNERQEQLTSANDSPSRKSVRFHVNIEEVAPVKSVTDVLESLKQRHSVKKSSLRRRRRYGKSDDHEEQCGDTLPTATSASVQGVLNKLQRRHEHGGSSMKRKRLEKSILETLGSEYVAIRQESIETIDFQTEHEKLIQIDPSSPSLETKSPDLCDKKHISRPGAHNNQLHQSVNDAFQTNNSNQPRPTVKQRKARSDLFLSGIVVLINGHTCPDSTTLMRLLHRHGGDLEKYETRRVTHIIAERLSTAKANIYKNQKNPTPVCRPEWITDSVKKGKLLPFGDYLLHDVFDAKTQGTKSIKSLFASHDVPKQVDLETNRSSDTDQSKSNYHFDGQVRTVGNDPNFLESYFQSSRLSYIGSFKQRVTTGASASHKPKAGSERYVLLIDMDCFFANVALKKYPQYKDHPVAVGHSPTIEIEGATGAHSKPPSPSKMLNNSSSELSTCNYIARRFGVKKGMFLRDAIKLCPQLVVLPYDFPQYESISSIVTEKLNSFAEQYNGSVEQVSCDESYLEIFVSADDHPEQSTHDFLRSLAEQIRKIIVDATECTASIGVGCNKFLAKLAADKVKPDSSKVVEDYHQLLDGLALRDLHGIGRKIEKKLNSNSLYTVNDIWDLGDDAERILGEVVGAATSQKIVQFCYGKDERPVEPQVRRTIGAECNYGVRFNGLYGPDYMLKGLSREVVKRMTLVGVHGSKLTLKVMKSKDTSKMPGKFLGHGSCEHLSRSMDIPLTRSIDVIYMYCLKLYEKLNLDKDEIRGMGLVVSSIKHESNENCSSPSKLDSWLKSGIKQPEQLPREQHKQTTISSQDLDDTIEAKVTSTTTNKNPLYDLQVHLGAPSMPTYSQLDPDVMSELPDDILKEVQQVYGRSTESTPRSPIQAMLTSPKSNRSKKTDKPMTIPGQVSVKRMLKLASVKSGDDRLQCANAGFTLSQLDCLPLETQLRIANNDNVRVHVKPTSVGWAQSTSISVDDTVILDDHDETHDTATTTPTDLFRRSRSFYQENIYPIQEFIRSTPQPGDEDINIVIEFFAICIEEMRVGEAIVILRAIKGMQHGWSSLVFEQIKEAVVDKVHRLNGYVIDTKWLGL